MRANTIDWYRDTIDGAGQSAVWDAGAMTDVTFTGDGVAQAAAEHDG